jgi:3-dehydroquinate synthase class II
MTGRITTLATEASTISQADLERIAAEERLHAEQQRKAARVIAAAAHDADDARMLLDMLGLGHDVVIAARKTPSETPARTTGSRRRSRAA